MRTCADHRGKLIDFKLIKLLLKTGGNPNAKDTNGSTPLHLLALNDCKWWFKPPYRTIRQVSGPAQNCCPLPIFLFLNGPIFE
jgi:hypothetical protein